MAKVLVGAALGVVIGYLMPPGQIFWFFVGGIAGYFLQRYQNRF